MSNPAPVKQYHITASGYDHAHSSPTVILAPAFAPDIGTAWVNFQNEKRHITFQNVYITEVKRNE